MTGSPDSDCPRELGLLTRNMKVRVTFFALVGPPQLAVIPVLVGMWTTWLWSGVERFDFGLLVAISLALSFWSFVIASLPSLLFIWLLTWLAYHLDQKGLSSSVLIPVSGIGSTMGLTFGFVVGTSDPKLAHWFILLGLFSGLLSSVLLVVILRNREIWSKHLDQPIRRYNQAVHPTTATSPRGSNRGLRVAAAAGDRRR